MYNKNNFLLFSLESRVHGKENHQIFHSLNNEILDFDFPIKSTIAVFNLIGSNRICIKTKQT